MIAAIIQARMGSKRLPQKVLQKVGSKILLEIMISRLKRSQKLEKIIICTTNKKEDDKIVNFCKKNKIDFIRGSSNNVMSRIYKAAKKYKVKTIVRLTADCPLIDPIIIDKMLIQYKKLNIDYFSNTSPPEKSTFPDGADVEIFDFKKFSLINFSEKRKEFLEHVTYNYWKEKKYKSGIFLNKKNLSNYRYTLDYIDDLKVLKKIINNFKDYINIVSTNEIVRYLNKNKNIYLLNHKCKKLAVKWKKN